MVLHSAARRLLKRGPANMPPPALIPNRQDFSAVDGPRLNLGCGFDIREGWLNIDLHDWHRPDLVCDVTRLTPLSDNFAAYALAQDILEHIHRERCLTAMKEWNRVLMPGGHLEIRVPDVLAIIDLMRRRERWTPEHHAVLLQCLFGTQSYDGDFHLNGFTELTIREAFSASGFELVLLEHKDEWLFEAVGRKIAHSPPDAVLLLEDDAAFLEQAYLRFLHRPSDIEGREHFLGKLAAGTPREVIMAVLREGERTN